jgi:O-6-methylguanine DNA methyltransferase
MRRFRADALQRARAGWLLAVLLSGLFISNVDITVVNIANPTIQAGLDASGAELELVIGGYVIAYAALLITGARLGAIHGYRRLFRIGVGLFTLASLVCGVAPAPSALIVARVAQGVGAALMVPQVLTGIQLNFEGEKQPRRLDAVHRQLDEYFAGRRRAFDLPIDLTLARGFRRDVLEATSRHVGYGERATYNEIAAAAGRPAAVRAAAGALAHNPVPIVVPCHRVVRRDGAPAGYVGGIERKAKLLRLESGGRV